MTDQTKMEISNNQLYFNINNGQVKVSFKKPIPLTEFFQLVFTGCLGMMNQVVANVPEEHRMTAKEDIYDMFNAGASYTLSLFAPEIEMRPHLTTQAILKAEDEIIDELARKRRNANANANANTKA